MSTDPVSGSSCSGTLSCHVRGLMGHLKDRDVTIAADDCVTVVYFEEEKKEKVINRAVALTRYCNQCAVICYEDSDGVLIVEIDDDVVV